MQSNGCIASNFVFKLVHTDIEAFLITSANFLRPREGCRTEPYEFQQRTERPSHRPCLLKCVSLATKDKEALAHPFVLNEALPVVPAKLVKKILKGEFIDMCELLKDNIEAERRRLLRASTSIPEPLFRGKCAKYLTC